MVTIIVCFILSFTHLIQAEETYNLEILFRCTAWDSYPDLYAYGISLAGGDINGDGYSDIAVEATHYTGVPSYFGIDVYVFFGGPEMDTVYDAVLHCPEHFGHSPSGLRISDVTGDSIGDVIVGDRGGGDGCGDVWVFFGGSSFDTVPDLHLVGEMSGSLFGVSVTSGDLNGDGCDDIIVGSRDYNGYTLNGRVYVYYGGVLLDSLSDIIFDGHDNEAFGVSVASGGDLNSDGYEDLVVGADENHEAYWGAGKVYVFFGGNPMNTWPDCWLHGEGVNHFLGWNGCDIMERDNEHDMMITSTSFYPDGFPNVCPGKVYLLYGGEPMDTVVDVWMTGQEDSSKLGIWCCSAGDVNADGFEDALVGAPNDHGFLGTGYLWLGGMTMDTIPDAYLRGGFAGQDIGWMVAAAGDVDGDGCDDMIFSNYACTYFAPTVWVCRYIDNAVAEQGWCVKSSGIMIGPNPFSRSLHVRMSAAACEVMKVTLYDVSGREVMRRYTREGMTRLCLDTHSLPCGVYFLHVEGVGNHSQYKVVKIN